MMTAIPENRKHIPELDGLRGVAILAVLVFHFSHIYSNSENSLTHGMFWLFQKGSYGVDLFFVLSGFLITGILLDAREKPKYFWNFWIRRFLRIFPLYYAYIGLIWFVVYPLYHPEGIGTPEDYSPWMYIAYLQNWKSSRGVPEHLLSHLWSLAIEEQFYLVWPVLVFLIPRKPLGWVCIFVAFGSVALRYAMWLSGAWSETIHRLTPCRLDTLMVGAIIAIGCRNPLWMSRIAQFGTAIFAITGAAVALCWSVPGNGELREVTLTWFLLSLFFGAAVMLVIRPTSWLAPICRNRVLRSFGKYSYGIYVLHELFLVIFGAHLFYEVSKSYWGLRLMQVFFIPLMIGCSYAAAWVSYNGYEKWFLKLKDRYAS
jgi:peptidoglycan/LPS O-acetylase OafA/YrhL